MAVTWFLKTAYTSSMNSCIRARSLSVNTSSVERIPAFFPRLYSLKVMPTFFHISVVASFPPTTPIEPVSVVASAKYRVGGARDVIPAAACHVAHRYHERFFRLQPLGRVENDFTGGGRPARRIHSQHDGLDGIVVRRLFERLAHFGAERAQASSEQAGGRIPRR